MMKRLAAGAALLTGLHMGLATQSEAADRGFYFGAEIGGARYDSSWGDVFSLAADQSFSQNNGLLTSEEFSRSDTGFSVLGGYRFFPYLAVEVGYVDLGEANYTANGVLPTLPILPGQPNNVTLNIDRRVRGGTAAAIGVLPLSPQWELFGRGGILFAHSEIDISAFGNGDRSARKVSDDSGEVILGVGAAFKPAAHWTFKVEYRLLSDTGDNEDGDERVDFLNFGVTYRL